MQLNPQTSISLHKFPLSEVVMEQISGWTSIAMTMHRTSDIITDKFITINSWLLVTNIPNCDIICLRNYILLGSELITTHTCLRRHEQVFTFHNIFLLIPTGYCTRLLLFNAGCQEDPNVRNFTLIFIKRMYPGIEPWPSG